MTIISTILLSFVFRSSRVECIVGGFYFFCCAPVHTAHNSNQKQQQPAVTHSSIETFCIHLMCWTHAESLSGVLCCCSKCSIFQRQTQHRVTLGTSACIIRFLLFRIIFSILRTVQYLDVFAFVDSFFFCPELSENAFNFVPNPYANIAEHWHRLQFDWFFDREQKRKYYVRISFLN